MTNKLVQINYRKSLLNEILTECPICCVEFDNQEEITPLPCSARHYFHPNCISGWLERRNTCPLCSKIITPSTKYEYRTSILTHSIIRNFAAT